MKDLQSIKNRWRNMKTHPTPGKSSTAPLVFVWEDEPDIEGLTMRWQLTREDAVDWFHSFSRSQCRYNPWGNEWDIYEGWDKDGIADEEWFELWWYGLTRAGFPQSVASGAPIKTYEDALSVVPLGYQIPEPQIPSIVPMSSLSAPLAITSSISPDLPHMSTSCPPVEPACLLPPPSPSSSSSVSMAPAPELSGSQPCSTSFNAELNELLPRPCSFGSGFVDLLQQFEPLQDTLLYHYGFYYEPSPACATPSMCGLPS
jgi:hypothetical protein